MGALQLSRTVLDKYPDMLSAHFIGRLLPEVRNLSYIRSLVHQCDNEGFVHNCLVPLRHYLASPGGPLKVSLQFVFFIKVDTETLHHLYVHFSMVNDNLAKEF